MSKSNLPPPLPYAVLRGHQDAVTSIEFLSDSSRLLSGAADGELKVWDLSIKRASISLKAHSQSILSVHTIGDNKIASSSRDGTFKIWDLNSISSSSEPSVTLMTRCEHFCPSTSCGENLVVTPDHHSNILIWDLRESHSSPVSMLAQDDSRRSSEQRTGMLTSVLLRSYNEVPSFMIFGGYEDGSIIQYDIRSNKLLREYKVGLEPVLAMDVRPNFDAILCGGGDDHVYKIVSEDGLALHESCERLQEYVKASIGSPGTSTIKYRADGKLLITGHWDNTVRAFDQKRLKPLGVFGHHGGSVYSVAFGKEDAGYIFATSAKDKTIAIWDLFRDSYKPR